MLTLVHLGLRWLGEQGAQKRLYELYYYRII